MNTVEIIDIYKNELNLTAKELSEEYGVTKTMIYLIHNEKIHTRITKNYKKGKLRDKRIVLDEEKVKEIYENKDGLGYNELCEKYGVKYNIVYRILNDRVWEEVTSVLKKGVMDKYVRKPNDELSKKIKEIYESEETYRKLIERYGVNRSFIDRIKGDKCYTNVTKGLVKGKSRRGRNIKDEDIRRIRELLSEGMSTRKVGKEYGINGSMIYKIGIGELYKDVN